MSIRTALARIIARKELAPVQPETPVQPGTQAPVPAASANAYAELIRPESQAPAQLPKLSPEEFRALLLQLIPDPVSGRPGPVQIMTPFETEEIVRKEMARLNEALTDALKLVSDTADRLAVFESSEKGKLLKLVETLQPRMIRLELVIQELLFIMGAMEAAPAIARQRDAAVANALKALGTALE